LTKIIDNREGTDSVADSCSESDSGSVTDCDSSSKVGSKSDAQTTSSTSNNPTTLGTATDSNAQLVDKQLRQSLSLSLDNQIKENKQLRLLLNNQSIENKQLQKSVNNQMKENANIIRQIQSLKDSRTKDAATTERKQSEVTDKAIAAANLSAQKAKLVKEAREEKEQEFNRKQAAENLKHQQAMEMETRKADNRMKEKQEQSKIRVGKNKAKEDLATQTKQSFNQKRMELIRNTHGLKENTQGLSVETGSRVAPAHFGHTSLSEVAGSNSSNRHGDSLGSNSTSGRDTISKEEC
jgi:hypothetical protein